MSSISSVSGSMIQSVGGIQKTAQKSITELKASISGDYFEKIRLESLLNERAAAPATSLNIENQLKFLNKAISQKKAELMELLNNKETSTQLSLVG